MRKISPSILYRLFSFVTETRYIQFIFNKSLILRFNSHLKWNLITVYRERKFFYDLFARIGKEIRSTRHAWSKICSNDLSKAVIGCYELRIPKKGVESPLEVKSGSPYLWWFPFSYPFPSTSLLFFPCR